MISKYLIATTILISFLNCKGQSKENSNSEVNSKNPIEVIIEREKKSTEKSYNDIGEFISSFEFKVKTDNKIDFEDGYIPWADLENPQNDLPLLDQKDDIIIPEKKIKIIIDYPLTKQYEFVLKSNKGFSRGQLLLEISKHYYLLYAEEEKTATIKTIPINKRTKMANRNITDGKYGIWGHDIADMDLSEISIYRAKNGEIIVILNVVS